MNGIVVGVLAYVAVQLLVGVLLSRGIRSEEDYLLAGRRLGYPLAIFSIFATWFGAETCIGAAGSIYEHGLAGGAGDPFGYSICLLLMGAVYAVALWRRRLTTLADLFRERYTPGVERLAVLMMVPTSILWAAAQIRAFGQVLSASSGLALALTISLAAAVVIAYTAFGGLLADATTDIVQGIALALGLGLLLVVVVRSLGGAGEAARLVQPAELDVLGVSKSPPLDFLESWLVPILGSVTAQELAARVLASRSPQVARNASLLAGGMYLLIGIVPATLGLLGAHLLPGLEEPERILPALARQHLGTVAYVVFAGALVSAILSTVDSNLLSASSLASHNLILRFHPGASERAKVRTARIGVVVAGLLAYALAMSSAGVYGLVEEASAFGGAGFFVVMTVALFSRFGGAAAAYACLLAGAAVQIVGTYVVAIPHPFTWSLVASALAYAVVGAWAAGRGVS